MGRGNISDFRGLKLVYWGFVVPRGSCINARSSRARSKRKRPSPRY